MFHLTKVNTFTGISKISSSIQILNTRQNDLFLLKNGFPRTDIVLALGKMNLFYMKMKNENCLDYTAKNTIISSNFLAWKICGKA